MPPEKCPLLIEKLKWMHEEKIWPNGLRYLWTDAHGICALLTLYHELQDQSYVDQAEDVLQNVYKVLGRPRGLRIGEEPDRHGQYYHYLSKWMHALRHLGRVKPKYHEMAVNLAKDIHKAFVIPNRGVHWKMLEDLSGPDPGYGLGGLDFYDGYVIYKSLDPAALSSEIGDMKKLIDDDYLNFNCSQDLGLGESLWMSHFFPGEPWSQVLKQRCEKTLSNMWVQTTQDSGYFCRHPRSRNVKFAFTNFGVSYGLQSVGLWPDKVDMLNEFFSKFKSYDEYDTNSITHVMQLNSWLPGVLLKNYYQ